MHHFHCTREKLRELVEDCGMEYRGHKMRRKSKRLLSSHATSGRMRVQQDSALTADITIPMVYVARV